MTGVFSFRSASLKPTPSAGEGAQSAAGGPGGQGGGDGDEQMMRSCLKMVDLPLSPAPRRRSLTLLASSSWSIRFWRSRSLLRFISSRCSAVILAPHRPMVQGYAGRAARRRVQCRPERLLRAGSGRGKAWLAKKALANDRLPPAEPQSAGEGRVSARTPTRTRQNCLVFYHSRISPGRTPPCGP